MKTTHVMMSAFAVATALMTSSGWAQEVPPIVVWDRTAARVTDSYQPVDRRTAAREEPSMATTETTFAMSPLTTGSINAGQQFVDQRPFGNYSANTRLDDLRGE